MIRVSVLLVVGDTNWTSVIPRAIVTELSRASVLHLTSFKPSGPRGRGVCDGKDLRDYSVARRMPGVISLF